MLMESRVQRLANGPIKKLLEEADALIVSEPQNVFLTSDLVPATLRLLPERLLMPVFHAAGEPFWVIADITEKAFRTQSAFIRQFVVYTEYKTSPIAALAGALHDRGFRHRRILIEKNHLPAGYYEELQGLLPGIAIDDATAHLHRMRMLKTADEHAELKRLCNLTLEVLHETYRETRIGDTEAQIQSRVLSKFFGKGFDTLEFITLARGRGDILNGKPTAARLAKGDMLRIDMGGTMRGWRSDIHRTAVAGKPSPEQAEVWKRNRDVHYCCIESMRPGMPVRDTYQLCQREYEKRGMYCDMPFIGHSFGVGQHELPVLTPFASERYEPGMIFMLEPMGIDPRVGGFSIEDMVLITEDGPRVLSDAVGTEEMIVIEA
jgi:Xaa-Pro aminopeptidase